VVQWLRNPHWSPDGENASYYRNVSDAAHQGRNFNIVERDLALRL
jgi:hypothetical protein